MLLTVIIISVLTLLLHIYIKYYVFTYWKKCGAPFAPISFPFGNLKQVLKGKISFTDQLGEFYNQYKSNNFVGIQFFHRPILLVTDPDLVRSVLQFDFKHFHSRGIYYDEQNDPLSAHLVSLNGEEWKFLRTKLTPTFTPNKLKNMFNIILDCANKMSEELRKVSILDIKDIASRYTTDTVASTAFGIECNSLTNPDIEFRKVGVKAITPPSGVKGFCKRMIFRNLPSLGKKLKLKVIDETVSTFFMNTVKDTVDYRISNDINRNDFLQLLIKVMLSQNEKSLTVEQIAAQCFVFFIAGVETSASTITFAMYELAKNVDMQEKLREEILLEFKKNGDKLTYEGIAAMSYLDNVVLEIMRKYPAFTVIMRRCTEDYSIPNSNITLEKGMTVIVPVYSIHHDASYYRNPEEFNPERFNGEINKNSNIYLPFGSGPRNCIGRVFAMLQVKIALATLIKDFEITLNEKSQGQMEMDKTSFILSPKDDIYLDVKPVIYKSE